MQYTNPRSYEFCIYKWATTYDVQQCGILTSVDSEEPEPV